MKNLMIVGAIILSVISFAGCGNQSETDTRTNNAPTQMGTDADSTSTPYMDTTSTDTVR